MNIYATFKALVLSKSFITSRDGQNTYYKISLMDLASNEAGTVSCTEEVAQGVVPMSTCECTAAYDDKYSSFKVTQIVRLPDAGPGKPAGNGPDKK